MCSGMKEHRQLAADQLAATVGEDRWQAGEARPVILAAAGGESSDAAVVWEHGAAHRGAAGAHGVNLQGGVRIWRRNEAGTEDVSEKSLKMSRFAAFVFRTREGIGHKRMWAMARAVRGC